ncbi:hypothetical protein, partial [Vibrio owensii]|uniref:hypothetical protein n=1 Tax=Vibrio owensii TaxID=696485 RepID=UPI0040686DBD
MLEQEQPLSLAEELSQTILDEYRCISVKINYAEDECHMWNKLRLIYNNKNKLLLTLIHLEALYYWHHT